MVDYKKIENKSEYIIYRDNQISKLDELGKEWTEVNYKQAVLLSYWYEDYEKFLRKEERFKSQNRYFKYKRGQILFVNFGYRVGHELGGNHYCVVVSKNDTIHSGNISVIPLRSFKNKINTNFQVDLEYSLQFSIMKELNKNLKKLEDINENIKNITRTLKYILSNRNKSYILESLDNLASECADKNILILIEKLKGAYIIDDSEEISKSMDKILTYIENRTEQSEREIKILEEKKEKALELNKKSIADINQITTISKLRILNPYRKGDILSNVILDSKYLDLINKKIKELYVFDK